MQDTNETTPTACEDFKIWQQNLRKSANAWEHMIKNLDPNIYNITCIQEPYLNPVNLVNASNLRQFWDVIYPTDHHTNARRSQTIMLVNKKLSKNNWHIVPIKSPNVMAIEIIGTFGKVRLYNIYNPGDSEATLHFLERHMATENNERRNRGHHIAQGENTEHNEHIVWMGDFNRHHPMWEMPHNTHLFTAANLDAAGTLINLLSLYNLIWVLPPAIATLEASNTKNHTRPDNIFCSAQLKQAFTQCSVKYHLRPVVTDHFPIISTLDLQPECIATTPKFNFREADWEVFREVLSTKLDRLPPPKELTSQEEFHESFAVLTKCIAETVESKVPKSKPSPYAKRWWMKALDKERKAVHKLGRKARARLARRNNPIHEEHRIVRNRFSDSIKHAKEDHWKEWLNNLTTSGIWTFHKYVASNPTDQIHTRIKTLQDPRVNNQNRTTQDNAHKSELLYNVFFKPPPENDFVEPNYEYPNPVCEFTLTTDPQIHRAIEKLAPFKAPGLNGVSNVVFKKCADLLVPQMGPIFRATFTLGVYPTEWKCSSTIVLRKPGRPDYSVPKAYRLITLLDTMAKILSSCVADNLTYIAEQHNLLPSTHFGGRPGRSTVDSLHLLTNSLQTHGLRRTTMSHSCS